MRGLLIARDQVRDSQHELPHRGGGDRGLTVGVLAHQGALPFGDSCQSLEDAEATHPVGAEAVDVGLASKYPGVGVRFAPQTFIGTQPHAGARTQIPHELWWRFGDRLLAKFHPDRFEPGHQAPGDWRGPCGVRIDAQAGAGAKLLHRRVS
jgi:hypothetical protein